MAAVLVLGVSSAGAATLNFSALLSGPSENPPNISIGIGTAVVTWDTTAQTMRVQVTFTGLSGNTTASHIHCCVGPPGTAGVATTIPSFTGFPLGVTSGTYDHTFDMTDASSYNPGFVAVNGGTAASAGAALLAGIQAGQAYLNIHTTVYPGGEIRGFLQGVTAVASDAVHGGQDGQARAPALADGIGFRDARLLRRARKRLSSHPCDSKAHPCRRPRGRGGILMARPQARDVRRGTGCRPSASTARSTGTGRYARTERRRLA